MVRIWITLLAALLVICLGTAPATSGQNRILLLDQSGVLPSSADYYKAALDELGLGYDVYEVAAQGSVDQAPLGDYIEGVVVWCVPYWTATYDEMYAVQAYLDAGGNLMFSCADIFARCFG